MVEPISEILDEEAGSRPVIVQFQNSEVQEGEESKFHTAVLSKTENTTLVGVATKNILYMGKINKNEVENDLYKRFLLISNRRTGKVRLVAVDTTTVTPQFAATKSKENSALNLNTSISELNKEFGSKKIKRITEQRERLQMNIDDVKEQLEQTVAAVELNDTSFVVDENDSEYRPRINRNASIVDQVYHLSDIVPDSVLDSLEEEATNILSSELDEFELSPMIKDRLAELQDSSANDVLGQAKLLLYVDYLIKFIVTPARSITKKFVLCEIRDVNQHILENFTVTSHSGRTRPLSMRDKTLCHILVLAMIAFNYELDMESVAKNVKMGLKKLQEVGRVLAFSTSSKNKSKMVLKIPLPPPVSTSPRKRRTNK